MPSLKFPNSPSVNIPPAMAVARAKPMVGHDSSGGKFKFFYRLVDAKDQFICEVTLTGKTM